MIVEVGALLARNRGGTAAAISAAPVLIGLAVGIAFMYLTAMLVKI